MRSIFFYLFLFSLGFNFVLLKDHLNLDFLKTTNSRSPALESDQNLELFEDEVSLSSSAISRKLENTTRLFLEHHTNSQIDMRLFFTEDLGLSIEKFKSYELIVKDFNKLKAKLYESESISTGSTYIPTISQRLRYLKILDSHKMKIKELLGTQSYKKYLKYVENENLKSKRVAKDGDSYFIREL